MKSQIDVNLVDSERLRRTTNSYIYTLHSTDRHSSHSDTHTHISIPHASKRDAMYVNCVDVRRSGGGILDDDGRETPKLCQLIN